MEKTWVGSTSPFPSILVGFWKQVRILFWLIWVGLWPTYLNWCNKILLETCWDHHSYTSCDLSTPECMATALIKVVQDRCVFCCVLICLHFSHFFQIFANSSWSNCIFFKIIRKCIWNLARTSRIFQAFQTKTGIRLEFWWNLVESSGIRIYQNPMECNQNRWDIRKNTFVPRAPWESPEKPWELLGHLGSQSSWDSLRHKCSVHNFSETYQGLSGYPRIITGLSQDFYKVFKAVSK